MVPDWSGKNTIASSLNGCVKYNPDVVRDLLQTCFGVFKNQKNQTQAG